MAPHVRWLAYGATALAALLGAGGLWGCCAFSGSRHKGPATDHFDGKRFQSLDGPRQRGGFGDLLRWQLNRQAGPWREWTPSVPGHPPPKEVARGQMRVTFVNHATVLIQLDGINILTDPIWSVRCSPVSFAGPRRVRPPGILFEDLPPIHAVLLSHNHYDHLDLPTLRKLNEAHKPTFLVGLGNGELLTREGIGRVKELDWWQDQALSSEVRVSSVPARHFSNRGLCDQAATLWAGYAISGSNGTAYFAGDTAFGVHFEQIRQRFGAPRIAILPIGAYRPEWFMQEVHISPAEAVKAHQVLGAGMSMGMHFGTFQLADDGQDEAPRALDAALLAAQVPLEHFWVPRFGEGRDVPPLEANGR